MSRLEKDISTEAGAGRTGLQTYLRKQEHKSVSGAQCGRLEEEGRMKTTKRISLFIAAVVFCLGARVNAAERVVVGLPVITGMEKTKIIDIFKNIVDTLSEKIDGEAVPNVFAYDYDENVYEAVYDNIESGDSDIIFWMGHEYAEYMEGREDTLVPLFSLTMMGQTLINNCIYARPGEVEDVSQLRGKRWAGTRVAPTRYTLYKEGIDEPLDEFFGSVEFRSDSPITNIIEGLENNEYDVFTTYDTYIGISGLDTKKDKPFEPVVCHTYDYTWTFMASKRLPHDFLEKYRSIMLRSHKDPDFAKFRFAFKMIEGRFIPVQHEDMEKIYEIYKLKKEKGWDKENEVFWKEHYRPLKKENED